MTPQDLLHRVESTLDELRHYLKADGGDIRLVEITPELVARIELLGACADCSMINMTMKGGVESALKKAAPELTAIEAINLQ